MLLLEFKDCLDEYENKRSYFSSLFGKNADIKSLISYEQFLATHCFPDDELALAQLMPIFKIICTSYSTNEAAAITCLNRLCALLGMPLFINFPDAFHESKINTKENWQYIYENRKDLQGIIKALTCFFMLAQDVQKLLSESSFKEICNLKNFTLIPGEAFELLRNNKILTRRHIELVLSSPLWAHSIANTLCFAVEPDFACIYEEVLQDILVFPEHIQSMNCIFWHTHSDECKN